mgnify:FL=1|tara:strand:+ start:1296 stop:2114 length:819 start_codon:yes stop_codon:yes gene_type:complete
MKLAIALPDSSLNDEKTLENKTRKIAIIARACGIFKVDEIIIYKDGKENEQDSKLMHMIFRYLATPQYFRRRIFPKSNLLKFAGLLPPLKTPNQTGTSDSNEIKIGDFREGLVLGMKGKKVIDVGINQLIPYNGKQSIGKKIIALIKNIQPDFIIKEVSKDEIPYYWCYNIKQSGNLFTVLTNWSGPKILTSRKSKNLNHLKIDEIKKSNQPILLVFGSTKKGIHDILGNKINNINNVKSANFFPKQGTETVRLEEAILGCLAILNPKLNSE